MQYVSVERSDGIVAQPNIPILSTILILLSSIKYVAPELSAECEHY